MKTLTREGALAELAAQHGYDRLVASNVLFVAGKSPYITVNDGSLFIAATADGRYMLADVQRDGANPWPDGAAFARLLRAAKEAGASRLESRSPLPGWC